MITATRFSVSISHGSSGVPGEKLPQTETKLNTERNQSAMNENTSSPLAALVAIDWADQKHDIALLPAGAEQPESLQLPHRPQDLAEWIGGLRRRFGGKKVAVAVEQKRGALIHALMGYEFLELYPVNPATLASLRKAFKQSGAKNDLLDRDLLLELLQKHRDRLTRWEPDDVPTRHLALLVQDRREAVNECTRLGEQLLDTLKNYFPAMIDLAGPDLTTRLACDLILRWPDLATLQRAKVQTLRRFFYARNFRHSKMLEKRLEALQAAVPLCEDVAIIGAGRLKATRLARAILALLPAIKQYDLQIAELFKAHEDAAIFSSLPGAGPALAPRLLVAFGSRRDRWRHSLDLATFSGIAPVIEQSGKRSIVHWRWACPKFVRQSLHEFARCSLRFCTWAKRFYETQRTRGKDHHVAIRALAFKWIRILFRCWQNHTPYDPAKYAPANL
jgi:transposase